MQLQHFHTLVCVIPHIHPHHLTVMSGLSLVQNKHLVRAAGYLNGRFTSGVDASAKKFEVRNPATGEVLIELPRMTAADVEQGAQFAHDAFEKWKTTTVEERSKLIGKMASLMNTYQDDLSTIMSLESGKPFEEAKTEIKYAMGFYEFYAEEAKRVHGEVLQSNGMGGTKRLLVSKQPIGPAGLITPWNFPAAMITRKVGPALAAGCTVLIKPASATPLTALALCAIADEAGIPPGVINCLTVYSEETEEVGGAMCHSPLLRKVSFTGSTKVGKWLLKECAETLKKVRNGSLTATVKTTMLTKH
jgi:succinate-semialdehyde dehydrogenase/glutarate-semialdehyde dehydrogenase